MDPEERKRYNRNYAKENKETLNAKRKERVRKKKLYAIDLLGGKCCRCGYDKCIAALEIHHPHGRDTDYRPVQAWSRERIKKHLEENECILLCSNCHREEHNGGL